MRKKHETGETEFLPVAGAGRRQIFHVDNVNTSYHTEFYQFLSINVAWIKKRQKVSWKCAYQKLPIIWLSFLAILNEKKIFFCKSIPNGLKRVKNMKPPTSRRWRFRPILPLENVNTSYHTEFHHSINLCSLGKIKAKGLMKVYKLLF